METSFGGAFRNIFLQIIRSRTLESYKKGSLGTNRFEDMRIELFDLSGDVGERHDLAVRMPDRTAALRRQLHDWRQSVGAAMPAPNPDYNPTAKGE
jgi:hypothetical protein